MNSQNEIILYLPDNTLQLEVRLENAIVWLTQAQMVMLYNLDVIISVGYRIKSQ